MEWGWRCLQSRYFEPKYEEFRSRTIWSLSNAFTTLALKQGYVSKHDALVFSTAVEV